MINLRNVVAGMITKERNIDLTQGVIWKNLLFFFLPVLAENLFQQLYTILDAGGSCHFSDY
jgi:Na+-driven multidrug efflux pump